MKFLQEPKKSIKEDDKIEKIQPRKDSSGDLPLKKQKINEPIKRRRKSPSDERVEQMKLMVRGLLSRVPSRRLSDFLAENGIENYCRMRKSKLIGKATTVALKGLGVE